MRRLVTLSLFLLFPTIVVAGVPAWAAMPEGDQPTGKEVRIAGIVLKWIRTDKEANLRRAEAMIREAAAGGAQIVCTTECFLDGYAIADKSIPLEKYRALGEPIPTGPCYKRLAALARELKILLVAGMLEADGEARCNTAVLISPEGHLLGKYRKQHLEHELVRNRPGTESPVFDTPYGRIGVMICADRRLPEIAGRLKEQGADFLLCLSGGMFGPKSNDWILQARSRETHLPIIFVHPAEFLVTGPDGLILDRAIVGDSLLIAPAEAGTPKDKNQVFYFDLPTWKSSGANDSDALKEKKMQRRDFLKGGITAVAASFFPISASADGKRQVTWAPYQNLDLDPQDMVKDEDIARIIWYAKEFIPQTCTGRPAYDPQNPNRPGTERRLEG